MQVEVCAFSVESCLNAQKAGATRIELCGGLYEGGTTPSYGLIKRAREATTLQLYVMIRPRGGDFCYDDEEFLVMKYDIEAVKELGADGVSAQQFSNLFFTITGFHGFHVFSGVMINIIILIMTLVGVFERRGHYLMVEKVGLYWHFVDLVWVFVFTFFYLV